MNAIRPQVSQNYYLSAQPDTPSVQPEQSSAAALLGSPGLSIQEAASVREQPQSQSALTEAMEYQSQLALARLDQAAAFNRLLPADKQAFQVSVLQQVMREQPEAPEGFTLVTASDTAALAMPPEQQQLLQHALATLDGALLLDENGQASLYLKGTQSGDGGDLRENWRIFTGETSSYAEETLASYRAVLDVLEAQGIPLKEVVGFSQGGARAQFLPAPAVYTYAAPAMAQEQQQAEAAGLYERYGFDESRPELAVHVFDARDPIATHGGQDLTIGGSNERAGLHHHVEGREEGGAFALNRGPAVYGLANLQESHFGSLDELGRSRTLEAGPGYTVSLPLESYYQRNVERTLAFDEHTGLMADRQRQQLAAEGETILFGLYHSF